MSANAVWNSYIENSGNPPTNAFKLIVYSRRCTHLKTLTPSEAKHLINSHNQNTQKHHSQPNISPKSSKQNNKRKKKSSKKKIKNDSVSNKQISKKSTTKSKPSKKNSKHITNKNNNQLLPSKPKLKSRSRSVTIKSKKHSNKKKQQTSNIRSKPKTNSSTKSHISPTKNKPTQSKNNQRVSVKQKHKKTNKNTLKQPKTKDKIRSKSISIHRTKPEQNNDKKHIELHTRSNRKQRKNKIRANSAANLQIYDDENDRYNTRNKSHKNRLNVSETKSINTSNKKNNMENNKQPPKKKHNQKKTFNKRKKNKLRANSAANLQINDENDRMNGDDALYCDKNNKNKKDKLRTNNAMYMPNKPSLLQHSISTDSYDMDNNNRNQNGKKKTFNKRKKHKLRTVSKPHIFQSMSSECYKSDNENNELNMKQNRLKLKKTSSIYVFDENNNEQKQIQFKKKNPMKKRVNSLWSYSKEIHKQQKKGMESNKKQLTFRKKKKDKIRAKSVCSYDYDETNDEKQSINTFFNTQKKVQNETRNSNVFNPNKLQKILLETDGIQVNDAVLLTEHREGIVKYIGAVHFSDGMWFGIELINGDVGAHDGSIDKQWYFKCPPYRGIFVQSDDIRRKVRHKDYHSSPKLRRRASLSPIPKIKVHGFDISNDINEFDNISVNVFDSDECFIAKEGIFKKRGALNAGFKDRWFKLYTYKKISYFELNSDKNGPKNNIEQGNIDLINVINISKKKTDVIKIESKRRKWVFKYDTCENRDDWYNALKQMCIDGGNDNKNNKRKKYKYKSRQKTKKNSLPFNLVIGTPVDISNIEMDVDYV